MSSIQSNAAREFMLPKGLDHIQNAIETLEKTVEELRLRLERICAPHHNEINVSIQTEKTPPDTQQAEYIAELFYKAQRIRAIQTSVEGILSRLEL